MAKANQAKKTRQYSFDFKRKTVEMSLNPEVLIEDVAERMGIHPPVLHSDNGAPMTSYTLRVRLADLGMLMSQSRPRVSNDNPYSESLFRTV